MTSFFKSRTKTAHIIVAGIVACAGLVVSDQTFRSNVLVFFQHHPDIGTELIALAGIITTYARLTKDNTQ